MYMISQTFALEELVFIALLDKLITVYSLGIKSIRRTPVITNKYRQSLDVRPKRLKRGSTVHNHHDHYKLLHCHFTSTDSLHSVRNAWVMIVDNSYYLQHMYVDCHKLSELSNAPDSSTL